MAFETPSKTRPLHTVMLRGHLVTRNDEFVMHYRSENPKLNREIPVRLADIFEAPVTRGDAFSHNEVKIEIQFPNQVRQTFGALDFEPSFVRVVGK